jgi:hypothetical protein
MKDLQEAGNPEMTSKSTYIEAIERTLIQKLLKVVQREIQPKD